jgi:hypothetical protein
MDLKRQGIRFGQDSTDSGCGPVVGFCERCNDHLDSVKGRGFLDEKH